MVKKFWLYLCIIQSIVILCFVLITTWPLLTDVKPQHADLVAYLEQYHDEGTYLPDAGYIPDAETAKMVGIAIIDNMTGNGSRTIGTTLVKYDEENRLWFVGRGYLFRINGLVIIEQDSGKIVKALLSR